MNSKFSNMINIFSCDIWRQETAKEKSFFLHYVVYHLQKRAVGYHFSIFCCRESMEKQDLSIADIYG